MNTIEAVEDRILNSEKLLLSMRRDFRKFIGELTELFTQKDDANDLFNDPPIKGFENRSVND